MAARWWAKKTLRRLSSIELARIGLRLRAISDRGEPPPPSLSALRDAEQRTSLTDPETGGPIRYSVLESGVEVSSGATDAPTWLVRWASER
jgi:hypothetical protein